MTTAMAQSVLTEEMLERFRGRAGDYDRENRFFQEPGHGAGRGVHR